MKNNLLVQEITANYALRLEELEKLSQGKVPTSNIKIGGLNVGLVDKNAQSQAADKLSRLQADKDTLSSKLKNANVEPLCYFEESTIDELKQKSYFDLRTLNSSSGKIKVNIKPLTGNVFYAGSGFHTFIGIIAWFLTGVFIHNSYFPAENWLLFGSLYIIASIVYAFVVAALCATLDKKVNSKYLGAIFMFLISPVSLFLMYLDELVLYGQRNIKKTLFVENTNSTCVDKDAETDLSKEVLEKESIVYKLDYDVIEPDPSIESTVQTVLANAYKSKFDIHTLAHEHDFSIKLPVDITNRYSLPKGSGSTILHYVKEGSVCAVIAAYIAK